MSTWGLVQTPPTHDHVRYFNVRVPEENGPRSKLLASYTVCNYRWRLLGFLQ